MSHLYLFGEAHVGPAYTTTLLSFRQLYILSYPRNSFFIVVPLSTIVFFRWVAFVSVESVVARSLIYLRSKGAPGANVYFFQIFQGMFFISFVLKGRVFPAALFCCHCPTWRWFR